MSASATPVHDSLKTLIVDDHASMRRLIASLLPQPMEGLECRDGADALAAYQLHLPCLVIMDVSMPIKDGFTAAAEIRQFDPEARIIFVTHSADDDMRAAATRLGAYGFLLKESLSELPGMLRAAPDRKTIQF